jgi:hypothetical protein
MLRQQPLTHVARLTCMRELLSGHVGVLYFTFGEIEQ